MYYDEHDDKLANPVEANEAFLEPQIVALAHCMQQECQNHNNSPHRTCLDENRQVCDVECGKYLRKYFADNVNAGCAEKCPRYLQEQEERYPAYNTYVPAVADAVKEQFLA